MILAVLSDTHWNRWEPTDSLQQALSSHLSAGFDAIWHAGDTVADEVLLALEQFAPLVVVRGNCDRGLDRPLPNAVQSRVGGLKLAMTHGHLLPLDHPSMVVEAFSETTDLVIHGHTHRFRKESFQRQDGSTCWLLNPGSVSQPRGGDPPGFGILSIEDTGWEFRHQPLA